MTQPFDPAHTLPELVKQIEVCQRCPLGRSRTRAVPGVGPVNAPIMFIGEAPGFHEDQQGIPFVGAAGNFLNELLAGINLKRENVYICNVIKCRPPQNRDPLPEEIEACKPYLDRQIELIKPKVIVTISRFAMARWFANQKISSIHGQARRYGNSLVVPFFHPAAALHQPSLRRVIEEDFRKLPELIASADKAPAAPPPDEKQDDEPPAQLKMF